MGHISTRTNGHALTEKLQEKNNDYKNEAVSRRSKTEVGSYIAASRIRLTPEPQLTPELRSEVTTLTAKQATIETEFRSALSAVTAEQETGVSLDAASTERRALVDDSDLGRMFTAVIEHRAIDGREGEMQAEFGLSSNQVPLAMLRTEHRAVTPAPGQVTQNEHEIAPYVFPQSVTAFMGIPCP